MRPLLKESGQVSYFAALPHFSLQGEAVCSHRSPGHLIPAPSLAGRQEWSQPDCMLPSAAPCCPCCRHCASQGHGAWRNRLKSGSRLERPHGAYWSHSCSLHKYRRPSLLEARKHPDYLWMKRNARLWTHLHCPFSWSIEPFTVYSLAGYLLYSKVLWGT